MPVTLKAGPHCWLPVMPAARPPLTQRPPPPAASSCATCCSQLELMLTLLTRTSSGPYTWPVVVATRLSWSCSCPVGSAPMPWTMGDTQPCTVLYRGPLQPWLKAQSMRCGLCSTTELSESGLGHFPRYGAVARGRVTAMKGWGGPDLYSHCSGRPWHIGQFFAFHSSSKQTPAEGNVR